ncbi:deoxyribonuclease IV [Candidatus Falkowbacteria bacterium]|jgi:deoxyribonuclease IV|nr:deoxyribonuclease IV [Candidatus Falkowbacteria bacterium]MBT4432876.1 deoxyribonuclease IV [Candidatus Falkowbacteria bacterium]
MIKIGAHVSVAGGLHKAIKNAESIGANTIQIFGSSPRQWRVKLPSKKETDLFKEKIKESNIGPIFLHAPYLVNIATPDDIIRDKSINNLIEQMKIAELIEAEGVIFHIGTRKDLEIKDALKKCSEAIKIILEKVPGKTKLIIENNAGEGTKVGTTPKEIGIIIKQVNSSRVGVCIDTAHSFESGIIDEYTPQKIKSFFDEWEKEIGKNKIIVLHINDSKTLSGSCRDRHENIGEGYIGLQGFKNLAKENRANKLPWILEVPGFSGEGSDKENIKILKSCF